MRWVAGGAVAALGWWAWWMRGSPRQLQVWSGLLLGAVVVALACYGLRRAIRWLPLPAAAAWLRWHLALAVVCVATYAVHAGLSVPHGLVDRLVAAAFAAVALSGAAGALLSRRLPARLRDEVPLARVPFVAAGLEQEPPRFRWALLLGDDERARALDRDYTLQTALRAWLLVHVPATWALLVFGVLHGALALAFTSDRY